MEIIHITAECYPVAKAGGLGDVVGALPKYQCKAGHIAKVIMPMYRTAFLYANEWTVDYKGQANLANWHFDYDDIGWRCSSPLARCYWRYSLYWTAPILPAGSCLFCNTSLTCA